MVLCNCFAGIFRKKYVQGQNFSEKHGFLQKIPKKYVFCVEIWEKIFFGEKKLFPLKNFCPPKKKTSPPKIVEKKSFPPKNATFFMFGIDLGQKAAKKTVWE